MREIGSYHHNRRSSSHVIGAFGVFDTVEIHGIGQVGAELRGILFSGANMRLIIFVVRIPTYWAHSKWMGIFGRLRPVKIKCNYLLFAAASL